MESFVGNEGRGVYNDFVAIFVKDAGRAVSHPQRIIPTYAQFSNGRLVDSEEILNYRPASEDQMGLSSRVRRRLNRVRNRFVL